MSIIGSWLPLSEHPSLPLPTADPASAFNSKAEVKVLSKADTTEESCDACLVQLGIFLHANL